MLNRKIEKEIEAFYSSRERTALLLTGARQVGKTFVIRETAKRHFRTVLEINFIKNPKAKLLFSDTVNEKEFFVLLSALSDTPLTPGDTLVFFDEVQECSEVASFIKFLVDDGRFKYVLSGSLLGVELNDLRSVPVGYLREVEMFPLDFEEFVSANGIADDVLALVEERCRCGGEIPSLLHERLMKLFRLYLVVGGMPAVVQSYVDTANIGQVVRIQKAIIVEYRRDAAKYDRASKLKIVRTLDLIPAELNRSNRRFHVTDIKHREKFMRMEDNFLWLEKAGIAIPVYNVDSPLMPLELAKKANLFKLFMNDVGLLACQCADGIQIELLSGNVDANFGAVYENFVAQELRAHGYGSLYYFNSKRHGEVDFLVETIHGVLPIEVKPGGDFKRHRALDNMMSVPDFALKKANVLCVSPQVELGRTSYLPIYATAFIKRDAMDNLVYRP